MGDLRDVEGFQPTARTRVLLALIRVYQRDDRATVRSVADETGCSLTATFFHLTRLLDAGLIASTAGTGGTLRPLVEVVAHG